MVYIIFNQIQNKDINIEEIGLKFILILIMMQIIMEKNKKANSSSLDFHSKFISRFLLTIDYYNMLECGDSVLIGVSGGPDSICLALIMMEIKEKFSLQLGLVHINHCLRGKESDRDAEFVCDFAEKNNLPLFITSQDVGSIAKHNGLSIEEAARNVRYSFYKNVISENHFAKIALAHNCDDNAELVLMNFLRGSGLKGLSGIPPKRDNWIIRPLIEFSKQEILDYLKFKKQNYIIDSSNHDLKFLRNKIRLSLLPHLRKEYNPSITQSLNRLSRILKDEDEWMESRILRIFDNILIKKEERQIQLSGNMLLNLHKAELRRIIRMAIKKIKGNLKRISLVHIDAAVLLILSSESGKSLDLPDRIRILKQKDGIYFRKELIPLRQIKRNTIG